MPDDQVEIKVHASGTADTSAAFEQVQKAVAAMGDRVREVGAKFGLSSGEMRIFNTVLEQTAQRGEDLRGALGAIASGGEYVSKAMQQTASAMLGEMSAANEAAAAVKKLGDAHAQMVPQVAAASAAIRVFEGNMPIRAAERFLTTIPGIGAALQTAFPVVGAIALGEVIGQIIGKVGDLYNAWNPVLHAQEASLQMFKDSTAEFDKLIAESTKLRFDEVQRSLGRATRLRFEANESEGAAKYSDARKITDLQAKIAEQLAIVAAGTIPAVAPSTRVGKGGAEYSVPGTPGQITPEARAANERLVGLQEELRVAQLRQSVDQGKASDLRAQADKDALEKRIQVRMTDIASQAAHDTTVAEMNRAALDEQMRAGQIGRDAYLDGQRSLLAQELKIQENMISEKLALARTSPDIDQRPEMIERLNNERLAIQDKYAKDSQALTIRAQDEARGIIQKAQQQLRDSAAATVADIEKSLQLELKLQGHMMEEWIKTSEETMKADIKVAQNKIEAINLVSEADGKMRIAGLKGQQEEADSAAKSRGAGMQERIRIVETYTEKIKAAIDALTTLKLASIETGVSTGKIDEGEGARKSAEVTSAGAEQKQGVDISSQKQIQKILQETNSEVDRVFGKMNSQVASAIQSWIRGTESFGKAFRKVGQELVADWTNTLLMMGVKWVEHHVLLAAVEKAWAAVSTALHLTTNATQTAADASKAAVQKGIDLATVSGLAGVAAAGAFASVMESIPFPENIAIAPAMATSAFAQTMAFGSAERGAVLGDAPMLMNLHPREMVLPSHISEGMQRMISGGGGGSGSTRITNAPMHYHAYSGQTEQSMKVDAKAMHKIWQKHLREGRG